MGPKISLLYLKEPATDYWLAMHYVIQSTHFHLKTSERFLSFRFPN
jgi:hypothetical protein